MSAKTKTHQPIRDVPDETLISNYQKSGEERFINELFRRYYHLVFGTCLNILKDRETSKDMTMILFEKLFERIRSEPVKAFNKWLYSYSCNECKNYLRTLDIETQERTGWQNQQQEKAVVGVEEALAPVFGTVDEGPDERGIVRRAILKLPKPQRECIRLFFIQNLSYKEIASKTDYDLKEVKSYLQNGKRRLRKLLEARLGYLYDNKPEEQV